MTDPNFLVVGAAKSGTTWLYSCLKEHPDVFVPDAKEVHFFSYPNNFSKGFDWYKRFFEKSGTETAIGEVSPSYLPTLESAEKIYSHNPNYRLICILRNPIDRAYSHYCMAMRTGSVDKNIDVGLTLDSPYAEWGLYFKQINYFLKFFSPDQFKVLFFDDIVNKPQDLLADLYSFLEVDPHFQPLSFSKIKNSKRSLPRFPKLYTSLKETYKHLERSSPLANNFLTKLRFDGYLEIFHQLNRGSDFPSLSNEKRRELAEFYTEDISALSALLNKDCSHWLNMRIKK